MTATTDAYHLARFVRTQDEDGTYERVLSELRRGRKTSHWMWFIFPQLAGLGHSPTAQYFAISSLPEARAYTEHALLGRRLTECTEIVADADAPSAEAFFGGVDAMKLRSSMTLFVRATPDHEPYQRVLDRYFDGEADERTDRLLQEPPST